MSFRRLPKVIHVVKVIVTFNTFLRVEYFLSYLALPLHFGLHTFTCICSLLCEMFNELYYMKRLPLTKCS